mgnify:CR=1 FL=1
MANRKFKRDWSRPTGALTSETYRGGRSYPLSAEIEREAETAGALEVKRGRSTRRR